VKRNYEIKYWKYLYYFKFKSVRKFRDIHQGGRCFIIGNGPSLRASDLDLLTNEITFGVNRIYGIFEKTDWRPTYYCIQDFVLIEEIKDEIVENAHLFQQIFSPFNVYYKTKSHFGKIRNISYFYLKNLPFYPNLPIFSGNVEVGIIEGQTVTYSAIQLAFYMGFTEVYLLGVDHSYNLIQNHKGVFLEQNVANEYFEGVASEHVTNRPYNVENTTLAYCAARKYAENNKRHIFNATRGGALEIFNRVDFDRIFTKNEENTRR